MAPYGFAAVWTPLGVEAGTPRLHQGFVNAQFLFDQKYFRSRLTQITSISLAVPAHRGAFRDRHGRWARDAVDAAALGTCVIAGRVDKACERSNGVLTRDAARGRRSRVVLTPRRRRQVCGGMSARPGADKPQSANDGDNKARSPGRARSKPLKPLRAGMPGVPVRPWRLHSRATYTLRARLRVRR